MEQRDKQHPKYQEEAKTLSESLHNNLKIQKSEANPMDFESTDAGDDRDIISVKADTDLEVKLIDNANMQLDMIDGIFAFKEELLEEKGSNVDVPRPMCFGPTRKQRKPKKNRTHHDSSNNPRTNLDAEGGKIETQISGRKFTPKAQPKRQRSGDTTPLNEEKRPKANVHPKPPSQPNQMKRPQTSGEPDQEHLANVRQVNGPDGVPQLSSESETLEGGTYAQVTSKDLNILVIDHANGINEVQVGKLEEKLMETLDEFLESRPSITPNFWASTYAYNNIKYVCGNEFSVNWLKDAINSLPPLWEGANLTAISMAENLKLKQKRKPSPRPQIKFFVPDGTKKRSFQDVCKHIGLRNPPIDASSWIMWKEESVPNGSFYHVSADEQTVNEIKQKGGRLFYYFATIKVIIPKGKGSEEE